ncbi:hypothetical protein HanPSC8_Chr17g0752031 [Helianthus annuus]|nr:hypothetical protein HanPSC8_Chr17g0752031 [Helianthus annuus]
MCSDNCGIQEKNHFSASNFIVSSKRVCSCSVLGGKGNWKHCCAYYYMPAFWPLGEQQRTSVIP